MTSVKKIVYSGIFMALHCVSFSAIAAPPQYSEEPLGKASSQGDKSQPNSPIQKRTGPISGLFKKINPPSTDKALSRTNSRESSVDTLGESDLDNTSDENTHEDSPHSLLLRGSSRPSSVLLSQPATPTTSGDVVSATNTEDTVSQVNSMSTYGEMNDSDIKKINSILDSLFKKEADLETPQSLYTRSINMIMEAIQKNENLQDALTKTSEEFNQKIKTAHTERQAYNKKRQDELKKLLNVYHNYLKNDTKKLEKKLKKLGQYLSHTDEIQQKSNESYLNDSFKYYMEFLNRLDQQADIVLQSDGTFYKNKLKAAVLDAQISLSDSHVQALEAIEPEKLKSLSKADVDKLIKEAINERRAGEKAAGTKKSLMHRVKGFATSEEKKVQRELEHAHDNLTITTQKLNELTYEFYQILSENSEAEGKVIQNKFDYNSDFLEFLMQGHPSHVDLFDPEWKAIQEQIKKYTDHTQAQLERLRDTVMTLEIRQSIDQKVQKFSDKPNGQAWQKTLDTLLEPQKYKAIEDCKFAWAVINRITGINDPHLKDYSTNLNALHTELKQTIQKKKNRRENLEKYTKHVKATQEKITTLIQSIQSRMLLDTEKPRGIGVLFTLQRNFLFQASIQIQELVKDQELVEGVKPEKGSFEEALLQADQDLKNSITKVCETQLNDFKSYLDELTLESQWVEKLEETTTDKKDYLEDTQNQITHLQTIARNLLEDFTEEISEILSAISEETSDKALLEFQKKMLPLAIFFEEQKKEELKIQVQILASLGFTFDAKNLPHIIMEKNKKSLEDLLSTDPTMQEIAKIQLTPEAFDQALKNPVDFDWVAQAYEKLAGKKLNRNQQKAISETQIMQKKVIEALSHAHVALQKVTSSNKPLHHTSDKAL